VGLVEQEWLDTLGNINPEEVTFLDFVEAGRKLGAQLKQEVCFSSYLKCMDNIVTC
jgi:5'-nucleotidase